MAVSGSSYRVRIIALSIVVMMVFLVGPASAAPPSMDFFLNMVTSSGPILWLGSPFGFFVGGVVMVGVSNPSLVSLGSSAGFGNGGSVDVLGSGSAVSGGIAAPSGGNGYPPPPPPPTSFPTTEATQTTAPVTTEPTDVVTTPMTLVVETTIPINTPVVSGTDVPKSNPGASSQGESESGGGGGMTTTMTTQPPAVPTITSVSPSGGPLGGGTSVTISGTEFNYVSGVRFGSTAATSYTVNSASQITATSPAGSAGTVDITVTNSAGTSATSASDRFTYSSAPVVSAISPATGYVNNITNITISGTGFTGLNQVYYNANASDATIFGSDTTVYAIINNFGSAGAYDIIVQTTGGNSATSAADRITIYPAPAVTGVAPGSGLSSGGESITITGSGFTGATGVRFGSTAATSFIVDSYNQIRATSPGGVASTTVDITVTTPAGTSSTSAADQYTFDP